MSGIDDILADFREWDLKWMMYDNGLGKQPLSPSEFKEKLKEKYEIKKRDESNRTT